MDAAVVPSNNLLLTEALATVKALANTAFPLAVVATLTVLAPELLRTTFLEL